MVQCVALDMSCFSASRVCSGTHREHRSTKSAQKYKKKSIFANFIEIICILLRGKVHFCAKVIENKVCRLVKKILADINNRVRKIGKMRENVLIFLR